MLSPTFWAHSSHSSSASQTVRFSAKRAPDAVFAIHLISYSRAYPPPAASHKFIQHRNVSTTTTIDVTVFCGNAAAAAASRHVHYIQRRLEKLNSSKSPNCFFLSPSTAIRPPPSAKNQPK